jgi:hypothetical protein
MRSRIEVRRRPLTSHEAVVILLHPQLIDHDRNIVLSHHIRAVQSIHPFASVRCRAFQNPFGGKVSNRVEIILFRSPVSALVSPVAELVQEVF